MDNARAAEQLDRLAGLLEAQHANDFRVAAWRAAADRVRHATLSLEDIGAQKGVAGIKEQLGVGDGIASALRELLATGRLHMLQRLEGEVSPIDVFANVPGIGPTLAHHVHARLGIDTLEDLELAAYDGRLTKVHGFGPRRVKLVREAVAGMLQHSMRRASRRPLPGATPPQVNGEQLVPPPVQALLSVDADYRAKAIRGELPMISPRRFNPSHLPTLPILHTDHDGFAFTAMYSNTERAHRLGRTTDWVVIYFERDGHEGQCTVVTEHQGARAGRRVVRGRENETPN
jgi:DNA polymerase (family 10)